MLLLGILWGWAMKRHEKMLWLALGLWAGVAAANNPADFERYRVILDRKPFGTVAEPEKPQPVFNPADSFARTIRISAMVAKEDGIKVGLFDSRNNRSYWMYVGDVEDGIELVSANYKDQEAILRKGEEMAVVNLKSGEVQAVSPQDQQARLSSAQAQRLSYQERRQAREQERNRPPPEPPKPIYTGEALEKHLQEYQMEVIRQGLPPLPIPLTPEMDQQLVNEGVLPPMQ